MRSRDQSLVTLAFVWQSYHNLNFIRISPEKGWPWFKFNNLRLALGTNFEFYTSVAKALKLNIRKFWGLIITFAEVIYIYISKYVKYNSCP